MEYTLSMVFSTTSGEKKTFSVTGVKKDLTAAQVNTLMAAILTQNIFTTTAGDLVAKSSATIIAKTTTEITMS